MYRFIFLSGLVILIFLASLSLAEIPKTINYQGMLTDDLGDPVTDTLDLEFGIYTQEAGGTPEWTETQTQVPIIDGLFNVILGSVDPNGVDLDFSESYWLEVVVEDDTMPRIQFTSVGYAYRAMVADTAYATAPGAGSHWSVTDSVLYTNKYWGIAKGGAGNVLYGDSVHTHVNLGVACTTGTSGDDYKYCTVGGGRGNTASERYATVGGGSNNAASERYATVGGGYDNTASGRKATVGGGENNTADSSCATVGGGFDNTASDYYATVVGGRYNTASGIYATVGGGYWNTASGDYSFAAGRRARANHTGAFVWADSSVNADFASTGNNQFLIRASGGVGIGTTAPLATAHVRGSSLSLPSGELWYDEFILEDTDAILGLYSGTAGPAGSAITFAEVAGAALADKWAIVRETAGGGKGLRITYGTGKDQFVNTIIMYLDTLGNVGIGTRTPGTKLAVDGLTGTSSYNNVRVNTATGDFYFESSSKRYKEHIQPLQDDFHKIFQAKPKSFVDKTSGQREIGYIAEEFDEMGLGNLVIYDGEGQPNGLRYELVSLYLLEIVKEVRTENEELRERIEALEGK